MIVIIIMNEELQVSICHHHMLITSLSFVHTARRCLELSWFEKMEEKVIQVYLYDIESIWSYWLEPGKSRNKVAVGEPAGRIINRIYNKN